LLDGRWHVTTPIFVTVERAQVVDFSVPVWAATDGFIIRVSDSRDYSSYEAIAADETIRLAMVTGQVQHSTARTVGVPAERIVVFADQEAAVQAVINEQADAAVSTAPGNAAYVRRAADPRLVAIADSAPDRQGAVPLGAFSFRKSVTELSTLFNRVLRQYLGTPHHLEMMRRHGFSETDLGPALIAAGLDRRPR
jgi:polar amino acid transport system substrate-binding protein